MLELRRLLYELKDQRPDICVRFRLLAEMWQPNFMRVIKLTENGVVLLSERNSESVFIKDLREIVQFEIDARYQNYHPHNHYHMEPILTISERHANSGR